MRTGATASVEGSSLSSEVLVRSSVKSLFFVAPPPEAAEEEAAAAVFDDEDADEEDAAAAAAAFALELNFLLGGGCPSSREPEAALLFSTPAQVDQRRKCTHEQKTIQQKNTIKFHFLLTRLRFD